MDVTQIGTLVGQWGFPIFVAIWMLIKQSKDTEKLISVIESLNGAIVQMKDSFKGGNVNG